MANDVIAKVEHVSHRYGKTLALDNVTLDIPAGQMIGMIGPDAAGKSTLLGLIAGVRIIQEGQVIVFGGQVIANITMLAVILTGAALIRERERGTVEHLLVMPVAPPHIMWSKIIANTLVVLIGAELSLLFVVQWFLAVPIAGSIILFFSFIA